MFRHFVLAFLVASPAWAAPYFSAPSVHVPPTPESAKALEAARHPIPPEQTARYLAQGYPAVVFTDYLGQEEYLMDTAPPGPPQRVAVHLDTDLDGAALFGKTFQDAPGYGWLGAVQSAGAVGIRLEVDLDGLAEDERLWQIDPETGQSFGPFTAGNDGGLQWLPTVFGDTSLLLLQSPRPLRPELTVSRLSHFYQVLLPKQSCPINVACDSRASVRDASKAVGLMFVVRSAGITQCTGSLLNNPATEALEPYFITANHCFRSTDPATMVEVVWDFRNPTCDSGPPNINNLPRSVGRRFLGASSQLDLQFVELNEAPAGEQGRTFLGWTTRQPIINEPVLGIHHPSGTSMKLAYGGVDRIASTSFGRNQTRVTWDEGVTEGGSSGSPLLTAPPQLAFLGVLSNGNVQICNSSNERIDFYSSFRDFFPQIACHLTADQPCIGGDGGIVACPAKAAFGEESELLLGLRHFRDEALMPHAWGRHATALYYRHGPTLAHLVEQSPEARTAFLAIALPASWLGDHLNKW